MLCNYARANTNTNALIALPSNLRIPRTVSLKLRVPSKNNLQSMCLSFKKVHSQRVPTAEISKKEGVPESTWHNTDRYSMSGDTKKLL